MGLKDVGAKFDARISMTAERTIRRMSRRDALRAAVVGGVASAAALSLGQRPALAASTPKCSSCGSSGADAYCCGKTRRCSAYGKKCASFGCPSGYILCKQSGECGTPPSYGGVGGGHKNRDGYWCEYTGGTWIACNGAGKFGLGYYTCYDCVASSATSNCENWCTCLGTCVGCNCNTAADVRAEHRRIDALQPAG